MTSKPAPTFLMLLIVVLSISSIVSCTALVSAPTPTTTPTNMPSTTPMNMMETAISVAKTEIVMTQVAIPTATFPPPTVVPLDAFSNGQVSPPPSDKLDYAMAEAPKIYTLLPYITKANPSGEYSGCTKTYDFHNFVTYPAMLPMETVDTAFLNYFSTEKWGFTEATSELIRYNETRPKNILIKTYDVYRISSKAKPAFERLKVILTDESIIRGEDHIEIRAELTHVETKENLRYLLDPLTCYNNRAWWLWIRLYQ
jgi:hypothetical protein